MEDETPVEGGREGGMARRAARETETLVERTGVTLRLPQSFYEAIFGGFTVMRHDGAERCVRFAVGDEEQGCFLPFYDHRPLVLAAARVFDAEPSAPNALALFRELGEPADLEVRSREVKGRAAAFLNLWEPAGKPSAELAGADEPWDPGALARGVSLVGRRALWYWVGLVPLPEASLRLLHVALLPR